MSSKKAEILPVRSKEKAQFCLQPFFSLFVYCSKEKKKDKNGNKTFLV